MTVTEIETKLALLQHDCQSLASLDGIEKGERRAVQAIVSQIANIRHALTAALSDQVVVPPGWKIVPTEATPDMRIAGGIAWAKAMPTAETYVDCADACYKAMLSAVPPPSSTAGGGE